MISEYIEKEQIPDWKGNYINYSKFEELLFKHVEQLPLYEINNKSVNEQGVNKDALLVNSLKDTNTNQNNIIVEERLEEITDFIENEIKRVYLFYSQIERELYLQINTRINNKKHYEMLGYNEIYNEICRLKQISSLNYNFVLFVNLNLYIINAMIEIYRQRISIVEANEIQKFLLNQIETLNSDLNYIIQFKIIDEVSTVVDKYITILEERSKVKGLSMSVKVIDGKKVSFNMAETKIENYKELLVDPNKTELKEEERNERLTKKIIKTQNNLNVETPDGLMEKINKEISTTRLTLKYLDISSMEYRSGNNDINSFIYMGDKIVVNQLTNIAQTARRSFLFIGFDESPNKFILRDSFIFNSQSEFLTRQAKINLFVIILHTFFYTTLYSLPLSTFMIYFFYSGFSISEACFVMALSPIMSSLSNYIGVYLAKYSFKLTLVLSSILLLISSLLFALLDTYNYIILPLLSRILTGLSSIRSVNRQYILDNTPKSITRKVSFYFQISSHVGSISGFGLSFIISYFNKNELALGVLKLTKFSSPFYIYSIFILFFILFLIIAFDTDTNYYSNTLENDMITTEEIIRKESETVEESSNKPKALKKHIFTEEERIMIRKINSDLKKVNNDAKFTTTNFLGTEIEEINKQEREGSSFIQRIYKILSFSIINFKASSDFIILYTSIYLVENSWEDIKVWQISMIIFLSMLIVTPVYLLALNTHNINLLIYSNIIILIVSFVLCFFDHFIYVIVACPIIIGISFYGELFSSKLFMQIIPYDFKYYNVDAGEVLTFTSGLTKGFTIIIFGLVIYFESRLLIVSKIIFALVALRLGLLLIMLLMNRYDLRVKALSRILNNANRKTI